MGASTCRVQALKTVSLLIDQSCTYYNARSLTTKIAELRAMVEENHPDANCVVESWLFKDILDNQELTIDNYQLTRLDGIRHGGSFLIFARNPIVFNASFVEPHNLKLLVVSVCFPCSTHKFCITLFYLPPSSNPEIFTNPSIPFCSNAVLYSFSLWNRLCHHIPISAQRFNIPY